MNYIQYLSIASTLTVSIPIYSAETLTLAQMCAKDDLHQQALERIERGETDGINDRDDTGMTPLLWAARFCLVHDNQLSDFPISQEKITKINTLAQKLVNNLIRHGANKSAKDDRNCGYKEHLGQAFTVKPMRLTR